MRLRYLVLLFVFLLTCACHFKKYNKQPNNYPPAYRLIKVNVDRSTIPFLPIRDSYGLPDKVMYEKLRDNAPHEILRKHNQSPYWWEGTQDEGRLVLKFKCDPDEYYELLSPEEGWTEIKSIKDGYLFRYNVYSNVNFSVQCIGDKTVFLTLSENGKPISVISTSDREQQLISSELMIQMLRSFLCPVKVFE